MNKTYTSELVIVGAGPAGLSAAMNASSEGIDTLVIEAEPKVGGQAKHSSRIENYLGFPNGLTGPQLMSRAYTQAKRFGAKFIIGLNATKLSLEGHYRTIALSDGSTVIAKAVLLAQGLQWRTLEAPGIAEYLSRGVYYGLNMDNAYEFKGKKVAIVGGANSAGQAAMWLSRFADTVSLVTRAASIEDSMSTYLKERIVKTKNITVLTDRDVTSASGDGAVLKSVVISSHKSPEGISETLPVDGLFIFIGATPKTAWLNGACELDKEGFITTKEFQTSCLGVFAAGDIRSGSVKRIASGTGEGSAVVPLIHAYLAGLGA